MTHVLKEVHIAWVGICGWIDGCYTQVSFAMATGISSLSRPRLVKGTEEVSDLFPRMAMVEVAAGTSAFRRIAQRVALASF